MIIAHKDADGVYAVLDPRVPFMRQVAIEHIVIDSTIEGPELVDQEREEKVWDATLVDGQPVRTERTLIAIDQRPRDPSIKVVRRTVPGTDVITYSWPALMAGSDEALAEIDLVRVVETEIPAGKISTGWTVEEVDGVPTQVHTLEDAPPPPPDPVPDIDRRQLLTMLGLNGMITAEEALAAARTGAVPAQIQAVFDQLGPADKLAAEITWATMSVADRGHPLVAALAATRAMTDEQIDDFFRAAAQL